MCILMQVCLCQIIVDQLILNIEDRKSDVSSQSFRRSHNVPFEASVARNMEQAAPKAASDHTDTACRYYQ